MVASRKPRLWVLRVTAASVGDYRPRLDRRVARSKARPADREVRRKEAREARSNEASTLTDGVLTHAGRRPRSKACRRKKKKEEIHRRHGRRQDKVVERGGEGRRTYRNPARNREKTRG